MTLLLPSQDVVEQLQQKIFAWYDLHRRELPWRSNPSPYCVLVSEMMLQQTQVDRVIPKYLAFLERFPGLADLAAAETTELLRYWSGLGYNMRALRLRGVAQAVMADYNGCMPEDEETLLALHGIGPYTAAAIMAFAFNRDVAVVDTNIRRVLIAELHLDEDIKPRELRDVAFAVLPKGQSSRWHNALMDYGALHLTARKTGIKPLSKQSSFKDSERFVRGQIVKSLLGGAPLSVAELKVTYGKHDVDHIVAKMEKDGLIRRDADVIAVST